MPSGKEDLKHIRRRYTDLKAVRLKKMPLWREISKYVGIGVELSHSFRDVGNNKSRQLDEYIDDPTAAISVNQTGDYLVGIMWGTGEKVFDILPSRYVLEADEDKAALDEYYSFVTDQILYHMNHPDSGYTAALWPYAHDQICFGTSGIGIFQNEAFKKGVEHNALIARNYGIDNIVIDVGKSNRVDYVFATYNWNALRIISEFSNHNNNTLPRSVQDAYNKGDYDTKFEVVFGMFPRDGFNPRLKGARGTKYRGVWFLEDSKESDNVIFLEESFSERPINIARMIIQRGDVWGRSSGTMLLSAIRSVNYMVGTAIEVIEKMADPALGVFSNAIFGDSVLDTSPTGLTVFNSTIAGAGGGNPTFPIYDVGDPSSLISFLVPYLNEKITTAFKIDLLLDFNSESNRTATEILKRSVIRGQALSGLLTQQKDERLIPDIKRAASILLNLDELGTSPNNAVLVEELKEADQQRRIIPQSVLNVIESGRPWFEIRFNNDLDKITRTETMQNLTQILHTVLAIHQVYPDIIEAVNWYKLLEEINDSLDSNSQILLSEFEFKDKIRQIAELRAQAMAAQTEATNVQTERDAAHANKIHSEAIKNARS